MNAQEMLLNYAQKNNSTKVYSDKEFIGMAFQQGARIYRDTQNIVVRVKREGKTVILTETVITDGYDMEARKPITNEETTEVFRVNL